MNVTPERIAFLVSDIDTSNCIAHGTDRNGGVLQATFHDVVNTHALPNQNEWWIAERMSWDSWRLVLPILSSDDAAAIGDLGPGDRLISATGTIYLVGTDLKFNGEAVGGGGGADLSSIFTTKGQFIVGTGSGTYDTLDVGTNNQIPVADSGASTGIAWKLIDNSSISSSAAIAYSKLNLTGSITTGDLAFTPALASDLSSYLPLAGGTMTGAIAMGSHKITGLSAGSTNGDALRYEQVVGVYALDSGVVHLAGTETITGAKTFSSGSGVNVSSGFLTLGTFDLTDTGGVLTTDANAVEVLNDSGKTTLRLSSTNSNVGLTIGGDTNLYRSAANTLKTDGTLVAAAAAAGNLKLSNFFSSTYASIGHILDAASTTYALLQGDGSSDSNTYVNARSGATLSLRIANSTKAALTGAALTMSVPIAMGSNKVTGLAAGSANGDALRYEQVVGLIAAKGDILTGSAAGALSKTGVGANNTLLVADSAQTGNVKWANVTNAMVDAAAAIAYSKLSLTGSIVNADVSGSAAIAYSKLSLTGSILNADISSSAAITPTKLSAGGTSNVIIGGATSSANAWGQIANAQVSSSAAIDFSKLAVLTSGNVLYGNGSNVATSATPDTAGLLAKSGNQTSITGNKTISSGTWDFTSATEVKVATAASGDNDTTAASTGFVQQELGNPSTSRPIGRSARTSAQTIGTGSWTAISFDTELTDTDSMIDVSGQPTRVTCSTPGSYIVKANVSWAANNTGVRGIRVTHKNSAGTTQATYGADLRQSVSNGATVTECTTGHGVVLAAGDYVIVEVYQDSGGNLNTSVGSDTHHAVVSAMWVGNTASAWGNAGTVVYKSAVQSIPNNTGTAITFDLEEDDDTGMHDTVTNNTRLSATSPGKYIACALADFVPNATGLRYIEVKKNAAGAIASGTNIGYATMPVNSAAVDTDLVIARRVNMVTGDYLEMFAVQTSGGSLNINSGVGITQMSLDRIGYQANPSTFPSARVYNNAAISVANNTLTALTFNSERHDNASIHDTSSNTSRLTVPQAGVYDVAATIAFAANATGQREVAFKLNGATFIHDDSRMAVTTASATTAVGTSTQYKLAATDYVECFAAQVSGGALNVNSSGNLSPEFGMTKIGEG